MFNFILLTGSRCTVVIGVRISCNSWEANWSQYTFNFAFHGKFSMDTVVSWCPLTCSKVCLLGDSIFRVCKICISRSISDVINALADHGLSCFLSLMRVIRLLLSEY